MSCELKGGWRKVFAFKSDNEESAKESAGKACSKLAPTIEWRLETFLEEFEDKTIPAILWYEIHTRKIG